MRKSAAILPNVNLQRRLARLPHKAIAQLPTPLHPLYNLSRLLGLEIWIKRDDLTGLEGGGNKTRKLEYLVGDALQQGADTLVTIGAIQSNHTRQTAAAAAKTGLRCALLHHCWTESAGPQYERVGNILLSSLMGADLYFDPVPRPIDDQSSLAGFCAYIGSLGHVPYAIPGGASEHWLGSFGYVGCAAEIVSQCKEKGIHFDHVLHCTGSSSTQAGLLAGFAAMGEDISVIGIADDDETQIKRDRVLRFANDALAEIGSSARVSPIDVNVIAVDLSPYGKADKATFEAMDLLARSEGLVADPVYEGKALRGLLSLAKKGTFSRNSRILLMHLGGSPAIHGYSDRLARPKMLPFPA